jgi:copper transport protein
LQSSNKLRVSWLVLLAVAAISGPARAHAYLLSADPPPGASLLESPQTVQFSFSEEIDPRWSTFALYDAQGQLLRELNFITKEDGLDVAISLEPLPQGVYTIAWKVLSAIDGHITKGVYSFGVGASPSPGDLIETNAETLLRVLSRWVHYLALMVWGGALVFSQLVYEAFSVKALWGLWGLATLTTISELVLYIHNVGELSALVGTVAGIIFLVKFGGLTGAGLTALIKRRWGWLETLLSLGTVSLGAASSHSAALKDSLAIALDAAHLLAGTIWAGGLLAVGVLLRRRPEGVPWGVVLLRFSRWALLSVAIIVGSGIYLASRHIFTVSALWETGWGRWLVLKLVLLMAILLLAARNLRQARRPDDIDGVYRRVWGEFFGIIGVLGAAAALTLSPPPLIPPTILVHQAGEMRIALEIAPLRVGPARFVVRIRDDLGHPIPQVQRVILEFLYVENQELGVLPVVATEKSKSDFEVSGSYLSLVGRWQITVRVRRSDRAEDLIAPFVVQVSSRGL